MENSNLACNLLASADRTSDRRAVVFYDRVIRYSELAASVTALAGALAARGIADGERFAIALPNLPELVVAYYAAFMTGAVVVPINPQYTAPEMEHILRDSGARAIVTHPMFEQTVKHAISGKNIWMFHSDNMGDPAKECIADIVRGVTPLSTPSNKSPEDTAVIAYTNAVGGWPLGAQLTHGGLNFNVDSCREIAGVGQDDLFVTVIPLYHAFSATTCMHLILKVGAATILNEIFNEKRVISILDSEPVTIFPAVPAIFQRLLETHGSTGKDYSSIRGFVPGGAPMPVQAEKDFAAAFNAQVFQGYGITECGPVTTVNPISERINKIGSIGKPLPGTFVSVRGADGEELPAGAEGELWVRGGNVMKGYHNQPEATAKNLTDGWMHTGDRAKIDDEGFVYITGLIKRMILVGGFNAYPAEIERIVSAHPDVETCEALGVDDPNMGQRVVIRAKLRPGATATPAEIRKFARASLAPYKTPKSVELI